MIQAFIPGTDCTYLYLYGTRGILISGCLVLIFTGHEIKVVHIYYCKFIFHLVKLLIIFPFSKIINHLKINLKNFQYITG